MRPLYIDSTCLSILTPGTAAEVGQSSTNYFPAIHNMILRDRPVQMHLQQSKYVQLIQVLSYFHILNRDISNTSKQPVYSLQYRIEFSSNDIRCTIVALYLQQQPI